MRTKIPKQVEAHILFSNRHTCCHCRDQNKDVQLHHIDGNNSNNKLQNLAVLCLDCHSKATGLRGLGKKYSDLEISKYKNEWESVVKSQFGHSKRRIQKIPKIEKQLFTFEIKKAIYEMTLLDDKKKSMLQNKFEWLLNISFFEDLQSEIIDELKIPFSLVSDSSINKPILLSNYLPKFFAYLAGPMEIALDRKEEINLLEAIEVLEYIHLFSVEENKKHSILNSIVKSASQFIKIAIEYKNYRIFNKTIKIIVSVRESTGILYYHKDIKMPKLKLKINQLLSEMDRELKKRNINWKVHR